MRLRVALLQGVRTLEGPCAPKIRAHPQEICLVKCSTCAHKMSLSLFSNNELSRSHHPLRLALSLSRVTGANGPHTPPAAEAVANAEDIGNVHSIVPETQEDTEVL